MVRKSATILFGFTYDSLRVLYVRWDKGIFLFAQLLQNTL